MLAIPTCIGARGTRYDHMYAALCNRYSGVLPPSQSNCISSHACCRTDFCSPERDGAQLRHALKYVTPMLFDAFNGHLEAGSDRPVQRTDASSAGAINCMIVGGGVALRFNGRSKHIPTMLTSREVDVIKFIAVGP